MKFTESEVERIRTRPDPADEITILLDEHSADLPNEVLMDHCKEGGLPVNEEFNVDSFEFDGDVIRAKCSVSFSEAIMSSCPEITDREDRYGRFSIEIGGDGEVEFELTEAFGESEWG
jgi:hypothetical protein